MKAAHRRAHRVIFGALGLGLPVLFGLALWDRRPFVVETAPPSIIQSSTVETSMISPILWEEAGLSLAVTQDPTGPVLDLSMDAPLRSPDPLLYWSAAPAADALPADAHLLGPLSGAPHQRFALPAATGQLIVYSLGHGSILHQRALSAGATP